MYSEECPHVLPYFSFFGLNNCHYCQDLGDIFRKLPQKCECNLGGNVQNVVALEQFFVKSCITFGKFFCEINSSIFPYFDKTFFKQFVTNSVNVTHNFYFSNSSNIIFLIVNKFKKILYVGLDLLIDSFANSKNPQREGYEAGIGKCQKSIKCPISKLFK